jgi:hypothetical protein
MALSRGAGLKREGPYGTVPGKGWPLLCSNGPPLLGTQGTLTRSRHEDPLSQDTGTSVSRDNLE